MEIVIKGLLMLSRPAKRVMLIAADSALLIAALWVSFSLSLDDWCWLRGGVNNPIVVLILFAPVIAIPVFAKFGLYRAIIRYLGVTGTRSIVKGVAVYAILWGLVSFLSGAQGVPRSVAPINAMVAVMAIGGSRMFARWLLGKIDDSVRAVRHLADFDARVPYKSRVVIFGAGAAGRQLAVGLGQSREFLLLAFVDDNRTLQGRDLLAVPILSQENLQTFVAEQKVDDILLAIPSITRKQRSVIIEGLRSLNVRIRTLPGLLDLACGQANYADLHDLDINDLLARVPALPDESLLNEQVGNKVVMVTGAGGSIGSELCRQVLRRQPKVLLLFELSEFALYTLHNELLVSLNSFADEQGNISVIALAPTIVPLLGSVADENRVIDIIEAWRPDIIYHAAAVKHVPIVEQNIAECVKTNVLGTLVMAKAAVTRQVSNFILVSTDKAVNPTNAMGASKRCCEMILQALAAEESATFRPMWDGEPSAPIALTTQFSIVRFGNVLGSSGSVVPHFRSQIALGGPVTLTHPDIIRYFMTIREAAQLVMQTGAMAGSPSEDIGDYRDQNALKGAEVYVLDMGDPVKIYDLARRVIELSGFRVKDDISPEGDIAIKVIGLRPGEKLYEELLIGNNPQETQHPRIMKASEKYLPWGELQSELSDLRVAAVNGDVLMIRAIFKTLVPEYIPDDKIADWIYKEQLNEP